MSEKSDDAEIQGADESEGQLCDSPNDDVAKLNKKSKGSDGAGPISPGKSRREEKEEGINDGEGELDFERRFLCTNGACIGVIGPEGRCKICNIPIADEDRKAFENLRVEGFSKDNRHAMPTSITFSKDSLNKAGDGKTASNGKTEASSETKERSELETEEHSDRINTPEGNTQKIEKDTFTYDPNVRVICSDGICIGMIGQNGSCNECGKPYDGKAEPV